MTQKFTRRLTEFLASFLPLTVLVCVTAAVAGWDYVCWSLAPMITMVYLVWQALVRGWSPWWGIAALPGWGVSLLGGILLSAGVGLYALGVFTAAFVIRLAWPERAPHPPVN